MWAALYAMCGRLASSVNPTPSHNAQEPGLAGMYCQEEPSGRGAAVISGIQCNWVALGALAAVLVLQRATVHAAGLAALATHGYIGTHGQLAPPTRGSSSEKKPSVLMPTRWLGSMQLRKLLISSAQAASGAVPPGQAGHLRSGVTGRRVKVSC